MHRGMSDEHTTRRRRRKTTEDLRSELLEAAGSVFARRGYGGASIREIADLAQTTQASIYRHYGSKADLFVAAVVGPFEEFLDEYAAAFTKEMRRGGDPRLAAEAMVASLYDHLQSHRKPVFALIAASRDPEAAEPVRRAVARLDELFGTLHKFGVELSTQGTPFLVERAELWQRLVTGMVVSATILDDLFMPHGEARPEREYVIRVMTDLVTDGFLGSADRAAGPAD